MCFAGGVVCLVVGLSLSRSRAADHDARATTGSTMAQLGGEKGALRKGERTSAVE